MLNYIHMKNTILITLCCAVAITACSKKAPDNTAVKVGNEYITSEEINSRIAQLGSASGYLSTPQGRKQLVNSMISEKLMLQAALKSPISKSQDYKAKIEEKQKELKGLLEAYKGYILSKMWIEELRKDKIEVSDKEVQDYYKDYPYIMSLGHIILPFNDKEAEAVYRKLKSGENFDKIAKEYSIDPETIHLPPLMRGEFLPELDDVISKMKVGEIQGVIRTELGLHIIKKFKQEKAKKAEVMPRIKRILQKQKFDKYLEQLQDTIKVEVLDEKYK